MSRAINVNATEAEVAVLCRKHGAVISASERLPSGGTRVVLTNGEGAATMLGVFGRKVITGDVRRTPLTSRTRP